MFKHSFYKRGEWTCIDPLIEGLYNGAVHNAGMPLPIGVIGGPGRSAFAVDEVRFWSTAKTPVAVWSHRGKFLSGSEPFLVSYLPLEVG